MLNYGHSHQYARTAIWRHVCSLLESHAIEFLIGCRFVRFYFARQAKPYNKKEWDIHCRYCDYWSGI